MALIVPFAQGQQSAVIEEACFVAPRSAPECMANGVLAFTGTQAGELELELSMQSTFVDPATGLFQTPVVFPAWSFVLEGGSRRGQTASDEWVRLAGADMTASDVVAFDPTTGETELLVRIPVGQSSREDDHTYPVVWEDVEFIEVALGTRPDLASGSPLGEPVSPIWTVSLPVQPQEEAVFATLSDAFITVGGATPGVLFVPESSLAQTYVLDTTSSEIATVTPSQITVEPGASGALFSVQGLEPGRVALRVFEAGSEVYRLSSVSVERTRDALDFESAAVALNPGGGTLVPPIGLPVGQQCDPFDPSEAASASQKKCNDCYYPGLPGGAGAGGALNCPPLSFFVEQGRCTLGLSLCELFTDVVSLPVYSHAGTPDTVSTSSGGCLTFGVKVSVEGDILVVRAGIEGSTEITGIRDCCHYQLEENLTVDAFINNCVEG